MPEHGTTGSTQGTIDCVIDAVVDTEGVPVETVTDQELPAYSIACAIEWMRKPENEARMRQIGQVMHEAPKILANKIDDEMTKVKRLLVDMALHDDVAEEVFDHFLGTIIGDQL